MSPVMFTVNLKASDDLIIFIFSHNPLSNLWRRIKFWGFHLTIYHCHNFKLCIPNTMFFYVFSFVFHSGTCSILKEQLHKSMLTWKQWIVKIKTWMNWTLIKTKYLKRSLGSNSFNLSFWICNPIHFCLNGW